MDRNIKGQVAFEFVVLVSVAFMVLLVFVGSTRSDFSSLASREERALLKDVTFMVQAEINLASDMLDGYYREFEVPDMLDYDTNYTISITSAQVISISENYEYVLSVINITGDLVKGTNYINKSGGGIYLNQ